MTDTHSDSTSLASCPIPVLVRTTPDQVASLLPILRARDDVCLLDEPLALLAYRTRRLLASSDRDDLTHLFTRRAFLTQLERDLQTASLEQPVSVLLLDLDHFKAINDEHGHMVGDRVLMHVASLLPSDGVFAARFGGEEFALIVPGADEASATDYAERLCEITRSHPPAEGVGVTVSIGVSTAENPMPAQELLRQADAALYAAKGDGRNRVVHVRALERQALRAGRDLRITNFEAMQRVLSERVTEAIARRGRRLLEALQNQADQDALTGLFNRGYLERRIAHDCHEAQRAAGPLSVALLDVDFFGSVNKIHGWPTGDLALRQVAGLVRQHVREGDWVARYGGEEIAVVLPGACRAAAVRVMERVREAIAAHPFHSTKGEPFSVTVSAGVIEVQPDETLVGLWQRLSDKLLAAKGGGRNQVRS